MPEGVIDDLEVIEIEIEDGSGLSRIGLVDGQCQRRVELAAVAQTCEGIVLGKELELILELLPAGDLLHRRLGHGQADVEQPGIVGLADIIVRARVKNLAQVLRAAITCSHEDVNVGTLRLRTQLAAKLEAAHAGSWISSVMRGKSSLSSRSSATSADSQPTTS